MVRIVALVLFALLAVPASAQPLARVSGGDIDVRTGPGYRYQVIGYLPDGSEVPLEECTRDGRWCLVPAIGWVEASWLVGAAAKMHATPYTFFNPFAGDPDAPPSWRYRDWSTW